MQQAAGFCGTLRTCFTAFDALEISCGLCCTVNLRLIEQLVEFGVNRAHSARRLPHVFDRLYFTYSVYVAVTAYTNRRPNVYGRPMY